MTKQCLAVHNIALVVLQASFVGAMAIADLVKTTLGPKGMVGPCKSCQHVVVWHCHHRVHKGCLLVCLVGLVQPSFSGSVTWERLTHYSRQVVFATG